MTKKRWEEASQLLIASYNCYPHSLTAYCISFSQVQLKHPFPAGLYAQEALGGTPALEDPYRSDAVAIHQWAEDARTDPYFSATGKADDPNAAPPRPPNPRDPIPTPAGPSGEDPFRDSQSGDHPPPIPPKPTVDLTGSWHCSDGGIYFIRQIGARVWWYGKQNTDIPGWANVFSGTIRSNLIMGEWADVPPYGATNAGKLTLRIDSANGISRVGDAPNFGGKEWSR